MDCLEVELKSIILERYGNLKKFCELIDMPWTTLDSILKRGVSKANITNIIKITQALEINTDMLAKGKIVSNHPDISIKITEEEIALIEAYRNIDDENKNMISRLIKYASAMKDAEISSAHRISPI